MTLPELLDKFVIELNGSPQKRITDPLTIAMLADVFEDEGRSEMADYIRHLENFDIAAWDTSPVRFYRKAGFASKTWQEEGASCVPILHDLLTAAYRRVYGEH